MNLTYLILKTGIKERIPKELAPSKVNSILFLFNTETDEVSVAVDFISSPPDSHREKPMKITSTDGAIIDPEHREKYLGMLYELTQEGDHLDKGTLLIDFDEKKSTISAFVTEKNGAKTVRRQNVKM